MPGQISRRRSLAVTGAIMLAPESLIADDRADSTIALVSKVLSSQVDDWNKGDLDGFLAGYWKSPRVVFQSGGVRSAGWEAMRDRYRRRYQADGQAMGRLEFTDLVIEPLGPETAMARGDWHLTMPDGKRVGGLFTVILRRLPEGWKIIHDHTSSAELVPATPPPPKRENKAEKS